MRRVVLLFGLAGCNQLFGLKETALIDASEVIVDDQDRDGVLDGTDNCPAVANTDQLDLDGDAIGDACDPCSFQFTPTADIDMDGITAAMDNCPETSNVNQLDGDGDGVGDVCDPSPSTPDRIRCFEDQLTDVARAWAIGGPWKWLGTSSFYIFHQAAIDPPFWMGAHVSGLDASHLAVRIGIQSPQVPTTPVMLANGLAIGARDQNAYAACELVAVMTDSSVHLSVSDSTGSLGAATLPATTTYLTLGYRVTQAGVELTCIAQDAAGVRTTLARTSTAAFDPSVLYLTATNATAAFKSVIVYETQ